MNLHEYQSKRIFGQHGIPVPSGEVAGSAEEAYQAARALGGTSVIKAQVLTGGRGKAGGVKVAKTPGEAEALAAQILGMNIRGLTVKQVLVDPAAEPRAHRGYRTNERGRSSRWPRLEEIPNSGS